MIPGANPQFQQPSLPNGNPARPQLPQFATPQQQNGHYNNPAAFTNAFGNMNIGKQDGLPNLSQPGMGPQRPAMPNLPTFRPPQINGPSGGAPQFQPPRPSSSQPFRPSQPGPTVQQPVASQPGAPQPNPSSQSAPNQQTPSSHQTPFQNGPSTGQSLPSVQGFTQQQPTPTPQFPSSNQPAYPGMQQPQNFGQPNPPYQQQPGMMQQTQYNQASGAYQTQPGAFPQPGQQTMGGMPPRSQYPTQQAPQQQMPPRPAAPPSSFPAPTINAAGQPIPGAQPPGTYPTQNGYNAAGPYPYQQQGGVPPRPAQPYPGMPGMQPMPGAVPMGQMPTGVAGMPMGQMPPGPGGMQMGQPYGAPQAPGTKAPTSGLTNDALPSVIDVLEKDVAAHTDRETGRLIEYQSVCRAVLPPLVTTHCPSVDYGNTVPELLRSSLYAAPTTANLLKDSGLPFILHIQPMAEFPPGTNPIPIVNHGEKGPVRCNRCKAYMSPYMKFTDGGRKFQCPFCLINTEVPPEYFAYLDSEGRRVDIRQRPELCLGTYEFLATKDYCRNEKLPEPPAFIFMIDVSYRAVSSGFVQLVCNMLKNELESLLPLEASGEESKLRVGIATFSDCVNFFNLKSKLSKPAMMTVNDFSDMFVPLVDGFLVRPEESGKMLDAVLDYIPKIFAESRQTDTILLPAVQAGMRALEAAGCPGKLFVFNFNLPVFDAPGKLKNREDRQILGTDKEKTLLKPQVPDYSELARECVSVGCSVDMFLFPNAYIDTATLGEIAKATGGQVYKYAYFQADKDGQRFLWDLRHNLKRTIAFDAVMRVRTSAGVRATDYFGNMSMPNTTEVHLASVDCEKAILAEIKHDDKLEDKSIVHIQVALLYTSLSAQRRVRVMNLALVASSEFSELYRCAEIDVIMNFMLKNSIKGLFEFSPAAIREGLSERTTKMLVTYRKQCSAQTPSGQLVLPESLKLLPVYANSLMRNDVVSGTGAEVGADDRSWLIYHANGLPVDHSTAFLYPRFYHVNDAEETRPDKYKQVRCTKDKMAETGVYLLENGVSMFLWLGSQVDPSWLEAVFGVTNVGQIDTDKGDAALIGHNNPIADKLRRFIERRRTSRPIYMRLTLIRQRDKLEPWFFRFLVEDKGSNAFQQSYVEFIYSLYKSILEELDK